MDRTRFDEILARYEDGVATPAELQELGAALIANASYRSELVLRNRIEVGLHELSSAQAVAKRPSVRAVAVRHTRTRRRQEVGGSLRSAGIAATVLLAVGAALWISLNSKTERQTLARISKAQNAFVARAENPKSHEAASSETLLHAGDSVSSESSGRAELLYADGTRVELMPSASVVLEDESGSKRLRLKVGEVDATVAKQPSGKPMIFSTPNAQATVLGTKLKLALRGSATRLDVTEGAVRLQKNDDGRAVEVAAGRFAVAEAGIEMSAQPIQPAVVAAAPEKKISLPELGAALVRENFENGRMEGWDGGKVISGGMGGSRFAIQSEGQPDTVFGKSLFFSAVRLPVARLPGGTRQNQTIFQYQAGLAIRFAYYIEGDAAQLRVQGFNTDQDDNFGLTIESPVRGTWTEIQLRISDFEHNDPNRRNEKLRAGDHFKSLSFFAGTRDSTVKVFRIDDVIIAPELSK